MEDGEGREVKMKKQKQKMEMNDHESENNYDYDDTSYASSRFFFGSIYAIHTPLFYILFFCLSLLQGSIHFQSPIAIV